MKTYYTLTRDTVRNLELNDNVVFECISNKEEILKLKIFSRSKIVDGLLVFKEN